MSDDPTDIPSGGDPPAPIPFQRPDGSAPTKVNDVDPKRDWDFSDQMPTLGVAPNGRIDVAWYDYRNDPTFKQGDTRNGFQDVYYASSVDGGRTWSKNRPLNDRLIDRRFGPHPA